MPIMAQLPPNLDGLSLIDLGCGFGELYYKILAFSGEPYVNFRGRPAYSLGVDVNDHALKFVSERGLYDKVLKRDIEATGLTGMGRFDIVLCNEFLEHTYLKPEFLEDLKALGKLIIVSVPNGFTKNVVPGIEEFRHKQGWRVHAFKDHGYRAWLYRLYPGRGRVVNTFTRIYFTLKGKHAGSNLDGILAVYGSI